MSLNPSSKPVPELAQTPEMRKLQKLHLDAGYFASCVNCGFRDGEQCGKFNQRPPMEYIALGCEYWQIDIPF